MIIQKMTKQMAIRKVLADKVYKIRFVKGYENLGTTEQMNLIRSNRNVLVELIRDNLIKQIYCENMFGSSSWNTIDIKVGK